MKQWYEELFENYAGNYEKEVFTRGTKGETDFIETEIKYDKSKKIFDLGCGTGRHSIELAKRGYAVTGMDLSVSMLKKARENAIAENANVKFLEGDARNFKTDEKYDLIIMLCEGSFPLMETDEMNFNILKSAYDALNQNGKFIFTTLNGLFPLFHSVKDFLNNVGNSGTSYKSNFDLMTFRDNSEIKITDDNGIEKILECNERYYVPSEISWLLKSIGFKKSEIFGCKLGAFSRKDKLTTEDYEMLVIAEK